MFKLLGTQDFSSKKIALLSLLIVNTNLINRRKNGWAIQEEVPQKEKEKEENEENKEQWN